MIHIVNKINHKNVYYAFINDLEFEFEVKDDKIIGFIPLVYRNEIKKPPEGGLLLYHLYRTVLYNIINIIEKEIS